MTIRATRATFYCGGCDVSFYSVIRFVGPAFKIVLNKKGRDYLMDCPAHAGISKALFEGRLSPVHKN